MGPDRLPPEVLEPLLGASASVAYWYRGHAGCPVDRCLCWAPIRRGNGAAWHGDGVAVITYQARDGRPERATVVSLAHGGEGPPRFTPEALDAGGTTAGGAGRARCVPSPPSDALDPVNDGALDRARRNAVRAIVADLLGLSAGERRLLTLTYADVWVAADAMRAAAETTATNTTPTPTRATNRRKTSR